MEIPNETSKDLVLVMNSIAVTTGGTWANFEKVDGSEIGHTHTHKEEIVFLFLLLRGSQTGTGTESVLGYKIYLSSNAYRPALVSPQPPVQLVPAALLPGLKLDCEPDNSPHLMPS